MHYTLYKIKFNYENRLMFSLQKLIFKGYSNLTIYLNLKKKIIFYLDDLTRLYYNSLNAYRIIRHFST